jgi:hypothetical protein
VETDSYEVYALQKTLFNKSINFKNMEKLQKVKKRKGAQEFIDGSNTP